MQAAETEAAAAAFWHAFGPVLDVVATPVVTPTHGLSFASCSQRRLSRTAGSRLQRTIEERKTDVHPVIDRRMVVVELLVDVRDAVLREAPGQKPCTVVKMILVPP